MFELEFDLQRFDDEAAAQDTDTQQPVPDTKEDDTPIHEDLNGLPEDIARETMAEWEKMQADQTAVPDSKPVDTGKQTGAVPYDRFKEKVDEANQLKAQLAEFQQRFEQQPIQGQQTQQPQQPQQPQQRQNQTPQQTPQQFQVPQVPLPQIKITPEISEKISLAIEAEAMALSGMTKDEVASLAYAENDDPRLAQWEQAKLFATNSVLSAIQQARVAQQRQAQQFVNSHWQAQSSFNEFTQKAFAEPDFTDVHDYAVNDFFLSLSPIDQQTVALSFLHLQQQNATPAEMQVIKNHFERAQAEYRSRARGAKKNARGTAQQSQQAAGLPRSDQIRGSATSIDGQISPYEFEKLLTGDFTKIDPATQKTMLGLS